MPGMLEGDVVRPWGFFRILSAGDAHSVKHIELEPGKRLSLQSHEHRSEHWVIVSGQALVVRDETEHRLKPGDSIDIPRGALHRIGNVGEDRLILIEVQFGDYLGEDDIVRYEDDFGRVP